jgi:uncharacterized protein
MRVNIDEIKDRGLDRAWDFTREQVDEIVRGDRAGYRASAPAHVEAHLERLSRRVMLKARSRAGLAAPCSRCLAPVEVQVPVDFALTLVPEDEQAEDAAPGDDQGKRRVAGSFHGKLVDEESYRGKEIDLDPLVREQLLLALPEYPLCREDCRGLCSACGQNLNEKDCGCERHVPDPRWAALEKFRTGPKPPKQ